MASYTPSDEFTDDRDRQDQLVHDTARADRDSRIDEGGSDEFADDRATRQSDVEAPDAGSQASLVEHDAGGGQLDLAGDTATEGAEWQADDAGDEDGGEDLDVVPGFEPDADADEGYYGAETRGRIKYHAEQDDLDSLLFSMDVPNHLAEDLIERYEWTTAADVYDASGRPEAMDGVGPANADKFRAARPLIAATLDESDDTVTDGGVYDPTDDLGDGSDAADLEGVESVTEQSVAEALDLDVDADGWSSPSMDEEGTVSWRYERGEMDGGDVLVAAGPQDRGPYWEVRVGFVSLLESVRVAVREGEDEAVEWARGWIENQGDPPPMDPDDLVQVYEKDQAGRGPGAPLANAEKAAKIGVDPVDEDPRDPYEGRDVLRSDEPETVEQVELGNRVEVTPDYHGVLTDDDGHTYNPDAWRIVDDAEADADDADDQPPTERVESFADATGVPVDVAERIFGDFGTAPGKGWDHTEERIYKAADYGKERDRLLSVTGVGEARQKQIAAGDAGDDAEEVDDSEQQADADSETDQADPSVGQPDEPDSDDSDGALEPLAYTVEAGSETWGHATDALGLLRRNWKDARQDAEGYDRDDVSELVATINDRAGDDVDVTETEMGVLWHASSQLAEEDQRAANQLDRVLNAAMNDAERPAVDLPESLAEAVERSTDADGWQPHQWTRPSDSLYYAEYNRRGSSETVAIEPVGDGYSVTFVDVEDDETRTFDGSTQDPLAAVIEGLNDYYGDNDDGGDVPEVPTSERAGDTVEFGSRDSANEYRDSHPDALHPADDDRRYKTVSFHPDASVEVVETAETEAQKSKADDTKSYGQTSLTDDERDTLEQRDNWSWSTNGFEAMSAKAALEAEGATDWMNYYEPGEGVGGALKLLEAGKEAEAAGRGPTGIKGDYVDSEKSDAEIGRAVEKAEGKAEEHAREACADGEPLACDELLSEYGWSEAEVDRIKAAAQTVDEQAAEIYDPSVDEADDSGMAYEAWAAEQAPDPPAEPSDEELAEIAPLPEAEMTGQAYRALKKAWTGYKLARRDAHKAHAEADEYARVINGIRAVNDQEPLDMDALEWRGGPVLPDDPTEEYPAPDHPGGSDTESIEEAAEHGHAAGPIQRTIGDVYDPTEEF
jgi:hypothetical protein